MSTSPTAEIATASEVGDITEEQAVEIIRAADPRARFSLNIYRKAFRHQYGPAEIQWTIVGCADGETVDAHGCSSLGDATQSVIAQMTVTPAAKGAKLRAQAAAILARAEQLESQPE